MTRPAIRRPRRVADVPSERLALLNAGAAETATLTECLAVDFAALMRTAFPEVGQGAAEAMSRASGRGISRRMQLAGQIVLDGLDYERATSLRTHRSDTVRGWACFAIGAATDKTLPERLAALRPFADDPHFGVREWAWLALRPHLAADMVAAVSLLIPWTGEPSERLRRFASEATRPRGVWCAHIALLKKQPELALPILEPLRADPARYVQDSVGNWLNDAAKDQPDWVRMLCARWSDENPGDATKRICSRALRSIGIL